LIRKRSTKLTSTASSTPTAKVNQRTGDVGSARVKANPPITTGTANRVNIANPARPTSSASIAPSA
jgi:hypothetical protein